ncbi:MAG: 2,3-bisphosphoglycerate-independent phosphoglycerate mutase [Gemmatimonadetes bacterium]|nr:MAG: 2,3-bisphosphoglycerate-independent phosphoglycerate mutase [Gemmatimonadota bacterium]
MSSITLPDDLALEAGGRIVLVVLDGLGGLPHPETGLTELETARTPHMDDLARRATLGAHVPVAPGVTPGSGPAHLALFGYDPVRALIGRGVLSALGVGFDLRPGDLAARLNLATFDAEGRVSDRRAGRPSDDEARRVVARVVDGLRAPEGVEVHLIPEKEHRVVLVVRGEGLRAELGDTDPQREGRPALPVEPLAPEAAATARLVQDLLDQARALLADEPAANGFLARGFATYEPYPGFAERYRLRAHAAAKYPMYRGVAKLVGMEVREVPADAASTVDVLERAYDDFDFHFVHFKDPDSRGHDGDFEGKVAAIEEVDALLPRIEALAPDVLIVTGDHSTPALYREHSWHPVPTLIRSPWARPSGERFGEAACRGGDLGVFRGLDMMALALAHARRLEKYGA